MKRQGKIIQINFQKATLVKQMYNLPDREFKVVKKILTKIIRTMPKKVEILTETEYEAYQTETKELQKT
jgi:hypothetical protein